MIISDNIIFPYPIIGHSDDGDEAVNTYAFAKKSEDKNLSWIKFDIHFEINDEYILDLIAAGKAMYACEYDCISTHIRDLVKVNNPDFSIQIPPNSLSTSLKFMFVVIAEEDIDDYKNPHLNEIYKNSVFKIQKGQVLAFCGTQVVGLEKGRNDRGMDMMRFMRTNDKFISHDINDHYITIKLPESIFDNRRNPDVYGVHASLLVDALAYALSNLKDNAGKFWADSLIDIISRDEELSQFLDEDGTYIPETENVYRIAQAVLKYPHQKFFEKDTNTDYDDNE